MEGQILRTIRALLADELDGYELLEAVLCNSNGRQRRFNRREGWV